MINAFLLCIAFAVLQGCMVTHTLARNMTEDAQVVRVDQAIVEGDWLVVEFSIASTNDAKSTSSHANRCGKFSMAWDCFVLRAMADDEVQRKSSKDITLSKAVGMDRKAVYLGELNELGCTPSFMKRKASPEDQLPIIHAKSSLHHDTTPVKYVYFDEVAINNFYYIDRSRDAGFARVVQLRVSHTQFLTWYSAIVGVLMPVAFVFDVVTFPIQAIICGEVSRQYCPINP